MFARVMGKPMTKVKDVVLITLSIKLLVLATYLIGPIDSFILQQANADNNNHNHSNSCNDHHSQDGKCSNKDKTPFLLPFP
jgi:hypothetical protein